MALLQKWMIGGACALAVAGGCLLAYPEDGGHLAGLALILAGLQGAAVLMRNR